MAKTTDNNSTIARLRASRKKARKRQAVRLEEEGSKYKLGQGPLDILTLVRIAKNPESGDVNRSRDPFRITTMINPKSPDQQVEKFEDVVRKVRRSPLVATEDAVAALWILCGLEWVRPLSTWKPKGKSADRKFRSLATHVACTYPMPEFLFSAFTRQSRIQNNGVHRIRRVGEMDLIELFDFLAKGGSIRKASKEGRIPVELTKRQCHLFMQTPARFDIIEGVRVAQTLSEGGSQELADALIQTELGQRWMHHNEEPFWARVIHWFALQGMLDPATVGPLYDYIRHLKQQNNQFEITGRSVANLMRGMQDWHAALAQQRQARYADSRWNRKAPATFEPSGYAEGLYEIGKDEIWSVEEILKYKDLVQEGSVLHHCVASYWYSIEDGGTSIWSLRVNDKRRITIEVNNRTGTIVQKRGSCNRTAMPEENRYIERWAADNRLRVRAM